MNNEINTKNLITALTYIEDKKWSVIPCGKDKRPLIFWKEFQSRIATKEEIGKWWTQYPDAQVGVVCGEISNLTVIDFEKDADLSLIKDKTFEVKTGGGGRHFYFKYEKDFKNMVRVKPFVDVRSEGGYCLAPPSVSEKGIYTALNNLDVTGMLLETKEMLLDSKEKKIFRNDAAVGFSYKNIDLEYPGYPEGERNDKMTSFVGLVLTHIHPSLWDSVAWGVICSANIKNFPPLSDKELKTIFDSIKHREELSYPAGRSFFNFSEALKEWGPFELKSKNNNEENKESENIIKVEEKENKSELIDITKKAVILHVSEGAKIQTIDTDKTFSIEIDSFDEALLGGFSPGELIIVSGKTSSGKTTLLQTWTVTLSKGRKNTPLPSLWFSYEVLLKPLWDKFMIMGADNETPIYIPSYNESGNFEWVTEMIKKGIKEKDIKVVVIDHLGYLRPPKGNYSNSAESITFTVRHLKNLAVEYGLIILLQVHMRQTFQKRMDMDDIKGSSGIAQEADTVFFIQRDRKADGGSTDISKIGLLKNRKTGITAVISAPFRFGKFYFNNDEISESKIISEPPIEWSEGFEENEL